jgi:hypothetical protein
MAVFMVSFFSDGTSDIVREIAHMSDGLVRINTVLPIHTHERSSPRDYETMVAFSFPAVRSYMLPRLPVYIDDGYTTLRFSDTYVVFKKDPTDNPWNLLRTLMPIPDDIFNGCSNTFSTVARGVMFVDTRHKPSVFDGADVRAL